MVGSVVAADFHVTSARLEMLPALDEEETCEPEADTVAAFLANLEQRAKAKQVGPSEWYQVRNRPLLDVLHFVEALETPSSTGAASSS